MARRFRLWTLGECWRCDCVRVPVRWLGPVHTIDGHAPFMACQPCIRRLEERVRAHHTRQDRAPTTRRTAPYPFTVHHTWKKTRP